MMGCEIWQKYSLGAIYILHVEDWILLFAKLSDLLL